MKILNSKESAAAKLSAKSSSSSTAVKTSTPFSQIINENHADEAVLERIFADPDTVLNRFSELAEEIDKLGSELVEKQTPEVFNKYKKHIRLLVKGIEKNSELIKTSAPNFTSRRYFTTVSAIDEVLSDLAGKILKGERDRIVMLQLTNQMHGLVLDLLA